MCSMLTLKNPELAKVFLCFNESSFWLCSLQIIFSALFFFLQHPEIWGWVLMPQTRRVGAYIPAPTVLESCETPLGYALDGFKLFSLSDTLFIRSLHWLWNQGRSVDLSWYVLCMMGQQYSAWHWRIYLITYWSCNNWDKSEACKFFFANSYI